MDINPTAWPKAFGEALRTVCFLPPSLLLSLSSILRDAAATADIVVSRAKMSICVCLECVSAVPAACEAGRELKLQAMPPSPQIFWEGVLQRKPREYSSNVTQRQWK